MIVGFDWGNAYTKICTPHNVISYPSDIIPYRKIKVSNSLREHDFIFDYRGRKGIAGTLAREERTILDRTRKGDTKLHEDALIRLLIGLHQLPDKHFQIVVGQPINRHSEDKEQIISMAKGVHAITVNGSRKEIIVKDVVVGVEGGSAYLSNPSKHIHLIDIGSGTINFATVKDGRFINSQSTTIAQGLENTEQDYESIAVNIKNIVLDLDWKDSIYVMGGGAHLIPLPYPRFSPIYNNRIYGPELANAIGYYKIGEKLWAK
ncbi:ParM/StbA family protein [Ornithinibacillus scapharcae]|uniref:ParM/StbA family protein n=1 Tax=Ornithinibacillus scapharcae TaxID=1147159 RepID=UPI000225B411|nr:ParM/StbA family protein [Ornithinibacillus scapharcae]